MARSRLHPDRALTATERVQRFRARFGIRRLDILVDATDADHIAAFADRWGCSRQEVLKAAYRACLPAIKRSGSPQELFNRVRDALEAAEPPKRFRKR